jgi:2-polyprenyl-6-hydroxyphenyl methylase/3-demethylubiquinone-9 3-methyltransferase
MPLGPLIRGLFGPYERKVTEAYRRIFIDLDDFAGHLRLWAPHARRILEVGCGEGAMTERLSASFPAAVITGIDLTPRVGRLYRGDRARVSFFQRSIDDVARDEPGSYDLVVLCDVLHHVPPFSRRGLLSGIGRAMAPAGSLAVKDWIVSNSPIHWLCYFADRYLTGDEIDFFTPASAKALLVDAFGRDAILDEATVAPRRNNIAFLVRPTERAKTLSARANRRQ